MGIAGRIVITFFSFLGLIIFSFLIATFMTFLEFTNTESVNFNSYKRVEIREQIKIKAANLIQIYCRNKYGKNKHKLNNAVKSVRYDFRSVLNQLRDYSLSFDEYNMLKF